MNKMFNKLYDFTSIAYHANWITIDKSYDSRTTKISISDIFKLDWYVDSIYSDCQWEYDTKSSNFLLYGIPRKYQYVNHTDVYKIKQTEYANFEDLKFETVSYRHGFLWLMKSTRETYVDGFYVKKLEGLKNTQYVTKVFNGNIELTIK